MLTYTPWFAMVVIVTINENQLIIMSSYTPWFAMVVIVTLAYNTHHNRSCNLHSMVRHGSDCNLHVFKTRLESEQGLDTI